MIKTAGYINKTFLHCRGIGQSMETKLKSLGFESWDDCLENRNDLPFKGARLDAFIDELKKSNDAFSGGRIEYFTSNFPNREHWRILADYFDDTTFFDIETTGISQNGNIITVIASYKKQKAEAFVHPENLDAFLDLAENSRLLCSFNGNSFDLPFILRKFNIPSLDRPHVDLRWVCYHAGLKSGLKNIEKTLNIKRPADLIDTDGYEAVLLYYRWLAGNADAREKLIRYCKADAIGTYLVAGRMLSKHGIYPQINEAAFEIIG